MTDVLKGVRVVELSTVITAPLTGLMLADLGADVHQGRAAAGRSVPQLPRRAIQPEFRRLQPRQAQHQARPAHRGRAARSCSSSSRAPTCCWRTIGPASWSELGLARGRPQGRESQADPLLDHRLRRDRALQRAAGLRQCRGRAERHAQPAARSRSIRSRAGRRSPTTPPACSRPTASSARCTSASAAAAAAASTSTCWRPASPSSPIRSRTTPAPES